MNSDTNSFKVLALDLASVVMGIAGIIDNFLVAAMNLVGIVGQPWQVATLCLLISTVVMVVMRTLGGIFGWFALLFAVILLLQYIVPGIGLQG